MAGAGDDRVYGGALDDQIAGGAGDDYLEGRAGDDALSGGDGNDTLAGDAGSDLLDGGAGHDVLQGGAGDDTLLGNGDGDLLQGGMGNDVYHVGDGDTVQDQDGRGKIVFNTAPARSIDGGVQIGGGSLFRSDDGQAVFRQDDSGTIDMWFDGQHVTVLAADGDLGPRQRRADGFPVEDLGASDSPAAGRPMLGLPLRTQGAPRDPSYKAPFEAAQALPAPRRDPLILDLDGNGVQTLGQQAVTYFDHDANGFAELTGWVDSNDGMLVLDRDGNGRIDSGRELFGDQTVLVSGAVARSGVQALAEWDATANGGNSDDVISAGDAIWSAFASLRVWRDANSNGFTDAGELLTLDTLGISALSLNFTATGASDGLGNTQARIGSFSREDGSTGNMGEYLLARDTTISIAETSVAVSGNVAALPEVRGSGDVYDLRQAMARDAGLEKLVSAFSQESDVAKRSALLDQLIFRWAGCDALDPNSRGGTMDARKLATLEAFLAEPFVGALGPNPVPDAAVQLEHAYHDLAEQVYGKLLAQSQLSDLYGKISYTWRRGQRVGRRRPVQGYRGDRCAALNADPATGTVMLSEFARMLRGLSGELERLRLPDPAQGRLCRTRRCSGDRVRQRRPELHLRCGPEQQQDPGHHSVRICWSAQTATTASPASTATMSPTAAAATTSFPVARATIRSSAAWATTTCSAPPATTCSTAPQATTTGTAGRATTPMYSDAVTVTTSSTTTTLRQAMRTLSS